MSNQTGDDIQSSPDEKDCDSEMLCLEIKTQLEDLFTDSHLAEDGFLLKHLQKNKYGYVSLKLLTCLKKIKVLTTNWCMTLAGAESSERLEVNNERTKVRRIEPLPKWLLCSPTSKFLLAWNISEEQTQSPEHPPLSERILQTFSVYGSVTSVWILHPGTQLPKELQCYAKRRNELGQHVCAVVKFDRLEAVRKAFSILKAEQVRSNGEGMCVETLGFQSMHCIVSKDEPTETETENKEQPKVTPSQQSCHFETSEDSGQEVLSSPLWASGETLDTSQPQKALNNSMRSPFDGITSVCKGQFCGFNQRYSRMNWCSGDEESSQSPWVLRRRFAASALNSKATGHLSVPCLIQRVLRQPFGPGDTKGFQGDGGRLKLLQREEMKLSPRWRNTICSE